MSIVLIHILWKTNQHVDNKLISSGRYAVRSRWWLKRKGVGTFPRVCDSARGTSAEKERNWEIWWNPYREAPTGYVSLDTTVDPGGMQGLQETPCKSHVLWMSLPCHGNSLFPSPPSPFLPTLLQGSSGLSLCLFHASLETLCLFHGQLFFLHHSNF